MRLPGVLGSCCTVAGALMVCKLETFICQNSYLCSLLFTQESIFVIKLSVWTNFYVLISVVIGVILCIVQLFVQPIALLVLIILFDLLLFVFLQYFFLIINSFYQYLLQVKQIEEQESCYVTYFPPGE